MHDYKYKCYRFIGPITVIHQIKPVTNELIHPAQYRIHMFPFSNLIIPLSLLSKKFRPIDDPPLPIEL